MKTGTLYIGMIFISLLQACGQDSKSIEIHRFDTLAGEIDTLTVENLVTKQNHIDPEGSDLQTRILTPKGFHRTMLHDSSFEKYLRLLPLKPHNSEVAHYDGSTKANYEIYDAVVDLKIGTKDLHQCADAIMRLRAEYLWNQKEFEKIHFNFTNGFRVDYTEWMKGKRLIIKGNSIYWSGPGNPSNTYNDLWKYLELIFSYAGTLSLSKELKPAEIDDVQIGDIFIQGGSPGHAIIVVDMAVNSQTKEKIFLLAQSYMPAQEIQLLKNPNDEMISPWYSTDFGNDLHTPEWTFTKYDLKRFEE